MGSSPVAGCDDAKSLYEDSMKVGSMIDPKARQNVSKFKALCNSYNNESDSDSKSSRSKKKKSAADKMPSFDKLCLKDGEIETSNDGFFNAFINSTPELKKIKDPKQRTAALIRLGNKYNLGTPVYDKYTKAVTFVRAPSKQIKSRSYPAKST